MACVFGKHALISFQQLARSSQNMLSAEDYAYVRIPASPLLNSVHETKARARFRRTKIFPMAVFICD